VQNGWCRVALLGHVLGDGRLSHRKAELEQFPMIPALGMTSPLGIPNAPIGHTGIPLGATELATPGVTRPV
jgi:hypothetical protein